MNEEELKDWAYVGFRASAFPRLNFEQQMEGAVARMGSLQVVPYKLTDHNFSLTSLFPVQGIVFPVQGIDWAAAKRVARIDKGVSHRVWLYDVNPFKPSL